MTVLANEMVVGSTYFQRLIKTLDNYAELFVNLSAQEIGQVEKIFIRNYSSGRAQRVMGQPPFCQSAGQHSAEFAQTPCAAPELPAWQFDYLQKIVLTYRQESVRLQALAAGDQTTWQLLSRRLVDSAYKLLLRKGIHAAAAAEMAPDMAQQTCLRIYLSYFPCDVAFDTWTHVILKNQILHRFTRSRDLLDRQPYIESFDALQAEMEDQHAFVPVSQLSPCASSPIAPNFAQIEDMEWLANALAQLPSAERRAVIIYTYFCGLSDEEIALALGKSKNAVHTLRHRALKQLHRILHDR